MGVFGRFVAKRYLKAANARHLVDFPQVACFSFDFISMVINLDGQYERDQLEFLSRSIFPNLPAGACLDVGANIGNHSLSFSRSFVRVIAFEPHPRTFKLLELNAELAPNVTTLNLGASSNSKDVVVVDNPLNIGATSIGKVGRGVPVTFRLVRIDDVAQVQEIERITFMKFDIEGHEHFALEGARETILRHKPVIALEVLPGEVEDGRSKAVDLLRSLGYAYIYEPVADGPTGSVPRSLTRFKRTLKAVFTGNRPRNAERLVGITKLEKRNYSMLLCATTPISTVSRAALNP
jgi:FkbM family methyltransferase